jgi:hypothetical protein
MTPTIGTGRDVGEILKTARPVNDATDGIISAFALIGKHLKNGAVDTRRATQKIGIERPEPIGDTIPTSLIRPIVGQDEIFDSTLTDGMTVKVGVIGIGGIAVVKRPNQISGTTLIIVIIGASVQSHKRLTIGVIVKTLQIAQSLQIVKRDLIGTHGITLKGGTDRKGHNVGITV